MSSKLSKKLGIKRGKPIIGVVHLMPLPGSLNYDGGWPDRILERAVHDAAALVGGGVDGIIIENFGDAPFTKSRVMPHVAAMMAVVAKEIASKFDVPLGINVLRNDAITAFAVAAAAGARFIRSNIWISAAATDQGIIEGVAYEALIYRKILGFPNIAVFADVAVKHSAPIGVRPLEELVVEAVERGGADAVIITGSQTGRPPSPETLAELKSKIPKDVPVIVGSGVNPENAVQFARYADGFIIGTYFKRDGVTTNPVDRLRVIELVELIRRAVP
ncbi:MAG: phosphorybosylanthranilate isomerase [Candidatus Hydrothermota bacterium]|nr:MAG: phosphorybosylanthranilate isomerase [Candidatus Hydrothermae bacterium]